MNDRLHPLFLLILVTGCTGTPAEEVLEGRAILSDHGTWFFPTGASEGAKEKLCSSGGKLGTLQPRRIGETILVRVEAQRRAPAKFDTPPNECTLDVSKIEKLG